MSSIKLTAICINATAQVFTWKVQLADLTYYLALERDAEFERVSDRILQNKQTRHDYQFMVDRLVCPGHNMEQSFAHMALASTSKIGISADQIRMVLNQSRAAVLPPVSIKVELCIHDLDSPCSSITVKQGDSLITMADPALWPSPEQAGMDDWSTQEGGNSLTRLEYMKECGTLHFYNQVSGSGGDSTVDHTFRGELAEYLVEIMVQLHGIYHGQCFRAPTSPHFAPIEVSIHI